MGLGKADAKVENAERKAFLKGNVLELIDKFNNNTVIGTVRSWNRYKMTTANVGEASFRFLIEERDDGICTADNLAKCAVAYNGKVHDVIARDEPEVGYVLWTFFTAPNGERIR
jgi:hypothetical protein